MTLWIVIREAKLGRCEQGLLLPDRKLEDGPEAQREAADVAYQRSKTAKS